jgi:hypothetical protein
MEPDGPFDQSLLRFRVVRIGDATIHRADRRTLFLIEKAHAFGALVGNDIVDIFLERRMVVAVKFPLGAALVNRRVGAFGFARN